MGLLPGTKSGPVSAVSGQTEREEFVNSVIHGAGLALYAVGVAVLAVSAGLRGSAWHVVSFSVYGACLVLVYAASTVYHAVRADPRKRVLRVLDHASIYLLIAGTYTPFTLVVLHGAWGWSLFGVVWGLAAVGIGLKVFYTGRFEVLSTVVYVALGWIGVVAIVPLVENLPLNGFLLLVAGGVVYTLGTVFYLLDRRVLFAHAVWHVFVLGGSACHFLAVLLAVLEVPVPA